MTHYILAIASSAIIGYLLGSINTSLLVGKFYGVDVRKHGSGNAGMTNSLRVLGKKATILVIIGDLVKGFIACLVGMYMFAPVLPSLGSESINIVSRLFGMGSGVNVTSDNLGTIVAGVSAIIGHNKPLYFGFKGGKGILTSFAVILMLDLKIALIAFSVFAVTVAISRYVSLGSILASLSLPILSILFCKSNIFVAATLLLCVMALVMHRSNISRLLHGTENKLGSKKRDHVSGGRNGAT